MAFTPVDDNWLPRWTPSKLGNSFFHLSSSPTPLLSNERKTRFSEVDAIEKANFVVVDDETLPDDPNYRTILRKARIRKLPILKVTDVEFADRYIQIRNKTPQSLTLTPVITVQEKEDATLIFDESVIKYRTEDGEAEEILDHEILFRDPIVRSFIDTPGDEQMQLLSVLDENPLRIKKTRWKIDDVWKNYLSEAWFFTDITTCEYVWDEEAFNVEYQTNCDTVTPVEAVRAALFVFFVMNQNSVLSRMNAKPEMIENLVMEGKESTINRPDEYLSTTIFDAFRMGYAFTHRGEPVRRQAFTINEQDQPLFNHVDEQLSRDIQISTDWAKNLIDNHIDKDSVSSSCSQLLVNLIQDDTDSPKKEDIPEPVNYYYRDIVKATISFKKENLMVTPEFTNAIRKALRMDNDTEKWSVLRKVFDEFGYIWPTFIGVGGKVTWMTGSADSSGPDCIDENIQKAMAIFDNIPDIELPAHQIEIERKIIGGDKNSQSFETWKNSVDSNSAAWVVVNRANVVMIWKMLDRDLQDQVDLLVSDLIGQRCVAFDKPYQFRNLKNMNCLSWQNVYYDQPAQDDAGKIIVTAPIMSADPNSGTKWKIVPVKKDATDSYLRYGDAVYIQSITSDTERLCLDMSSPSPGRKGQLSLRETNLPALECGTDKWTVEYSKDINQDAYGNNVNSTDMNTCVQIADVFRLSFGNLFLASDAFTVENVKVRRKHKGGWGASHRLRNVSALPFASRYKEVLVMEREDLVKDADKMADWNIVA